MSKVASASATSVHSVTVNSPSSRAPSPVGDNADFRKKLQPLVNTLLIQCDIPTDTRVRLGIEEGGQLTVIKHSNNQPIKFDETDGSKRTCRKIVNLAKSYLQLDAFASASELGLEPPQVPSPSAREEQQPSRALSEENALLKRQLTDLTERVRQLTEQNQSLTSELQSSQQGAAAFVEAIKERDATISDLQSQLEQAGDASDAAALRKAQRALHQAEEENVRLAAYVKELQAKLRAKDSEKDLAVQQKTQALKTRVEELSSQLQTSQASDLAARAALSQTSRELESTKRQLAARGEVEQDPMRGYDAQAEADRRAYERDLGSLKQKMEALEAEKNEAERYRDQFKAEANSLRKRLRAEESDSESDRASSSEALEEAQGSARLATGALNTHQGLMDSLIDRDAGSRGSAEKAEESLKSANAQIQALQEALRELESRAAADDLTIRKQNAALEKAEAEKQALKTEHRQKIGLVDTAIQSGQVGEATADALRDALGLQTKSS